MPVNTRSIVVFVPRLHRNQQRVCHSDLKRHDDGRGHCVADRRGRDVIGYVYEMGVDRNDAIATFFWHSILTLSWLMGIWNLLRIQMLGLGH